MGDNSFGDPCAFTVREHGRNARITGRSGGPIGDGVLAPLAERYGDRWKVWPSAHGEFACAMLRRGLSWVSTSGRLPVGAGGAYVRTLVTDSPAELSEAIERENESIARLLADGTLRADRKGGDDRADGDDHEGRDGR